MFKLKKEIQINSNLQSKEKKYNKLNARYIERKEVLANLIPVLHQLRMAKIRNILAHIKAIAENMNIILPLICEKEQLSIHMSLCYKDNQRIPLAEHSPFSFVSYLYIYLRNFNFRPTYFYIPILYFLILLNRNQQMSLDLK